jgi:hypothetical protein
VLLDDKMFSLKQPALSPKPVIHNWKIIRIKRGERKSESVKNSS